MIATDTNILVYAHRTDSEWHPQARARVASLAEGHVTWGCHGRAFTSFCHSEPSADLRPTIHHRGSGRPGRRLVGVALALLLSETDSHWDVLKNQLRDGRVQGPVVYDARVATLCVGHGVTEFWTADRDFSRFPNLAVRNPLQD